MVAAGTQGRTGVPRIAAAFLGAQIGSGREQGKKSTAIAPISANRAQKGRFSAKAWSTGTHGDIVRTTPTTEGAGRAVSRGK